jgi:hypothetical protein
VTLAPRGYHDFGGKLVSPMTAQPNMPRLTGRFLDRCQVAPDGADPMRAMAFWAACEQMTGER